MVPFIRTTIQLLLSSMHTESPSNSAVNQTPACQHTQSHALVNPTANGPSISAISWGSNRMDVFGNNMDTRALSHKFWDGYQWQPSVQDLENLGDNYGGPPGAVSGNTSIMDIFTVGRDSSLQHKYFDGTAWKPSETEMDILSDSGVLDVGFAPSATSWAPGRLDIFSRGTDGTLLHKYFDGSSWGPSYTGLEDLGGDMLTGSAAISWGPNRNDIFAVELLTGLVHKYWDGSNWSDWEDLGAGSLFYETPAVVSWAENRLDVFAINSDGSLTHAYWDGSQWKIEDLGGSKLTGTVAAVSWVVGRIDIVALGQDAGYYYKYFDGSNWSDWFPKGGSFSSAPSVVSWSKNRLDIWGVTTDNQLGHQTWYGNGWYPGPDQWEMLGGPVEAYIH